ncbi:TetR/AcrR family transcriptional regulator [Dactylosporangium sp. NPDC051485]|uniref:TetR/AcrR family transcriptional regulator n=1 Tax=Dactylosporangium sp. NPDC051485 TaxID=3154846 RepID=UPI00344785D2
MSGDPVAATPARRSLSASQQSRRARILDAAVSLAIGGGYGAVGMREVATAADVALATVYRYFPSKDHLLLGVMADSLERLRVRRRQPRGGTSAERVLAVIEQTTRSMLRNPELSSAILHAWVVVAGEPGADETRISTSIRDAVLAAMARPPAPPTPDNLMRIKLLTRVWFSELLFRANGRESDTTLLETVRAAVSYLFPDE